MEKKLGKIIKAQFGFFMDNDYLFGLILEFDMNGSQVGSSSRYMENITNSVKWDLLSERDQAITKVILETAEILKAAKVNTIEELKGCPVEVTMDKGLFREVRILTEVI